MTPAPVVPVPNPETPNTPWPNTPLACGLLLVPMTPALLGDEVTVAPLMAEPVLFVMVVTAEVGLLTPLWTAVASAAAAAGSGRSTALATSPTIAPPVPASTARRVRSTEPSVVIRG